MMLTGHVSGLSSNLDVEISPRRKKRNNQATTRNFLPKLNQSVIVKESDSRHGHRRRNDLMSSQSYATTTRVNVLSQDSDSDNLGEITEARRMASRRAIDILMASIKRQQI